MISQTKDVLDASYISSLLTPRHDVSIEVIDAVESTNSLMKTRAGELCEGHVIIADRQSGGRGRLGKTFFSPPGSGVYFSILLKPRTGVTDSVIVTSAAAVAACGAIHDVFGGDPWIKWVNDIYIGERKVCGILAESVLSPSGVPEYIVLGVGFNVYQPDSGFPEEIKSIAGYLSEEKIKNGRNNLAASFIFRFLALYGDTARSRIIGLYRRLERTTGKNILVLSGDCARDAAAVGIDDDCRLVVRYPDGKEEALFSGEISIRFNKQ